MRHATPLLGMVGSCCFYAAVLAFLWLLLLLLFKDWRKTDILIDNFCST
jgi:hypothetical protein